MLCSVAVEWVGRGKASGMLKGAEVFGLLPQRRYGATKKAASEKKRLLAFIAFCQQSWLQSAVTC